VPSARRTVTIHRPPADVFAYVANGLNATKWRPGVLDIELVSGDGAGAIYRQGVRGPGGRRIAADYEVTAYEPNARLEFKAIAGPVRPTGGYTFEETPDGTAVTFWLEASLGGLKGLLLGRQVQQTMDAEMRALDRLKEQLEG
jgi:uncharacterized protein YndB with AHSA1/START domain